MKSTKSLFYIGQVVQHRLFDYRGVIIDVDPVFLNDEEWYEHVALSRPPKDKPWYRVLVHNGTHETYVAERNIKPDDSSDPVNHPMIEHYFSTFENGHYKRKMNEN